MVATTTATGIYLGKAIANAETNADYVYYLLNAPDGGAVGTGGASASTAIPDLGTLTSDSGCAESMGTIKEKLNGILAALRSAGIIAS
jgi:hypothetical protein